MMQTQWNNPDNRFQRISLENMLHCLGIGEARYEPGFYAGQLKKLEKQILYRQLLLEEVIHRTNHTLQRAISAIDAQIAAANDAWKAHDLRVLRAQLRKLRGAQEYIYGPGDCVGWSLKTRLSEICSSTFESFGRGGAPVALSLKVDDIELTPDQEICVCLMSQDLVTDALKHGFPCGRRGIISIEFSHDTDSLCHLTVTDNGVRKFAPPYQRSGLTLVEGLAFLLEGQLEVNLNRGTTVRVSFPLSAG